MAMSTTLSPTGRRTRERVASTDSDAGPVTPSRKSSRRASTSPYFKRKRTSKASPESLNQKSLNTPLSSPIGSDALPTPDLSPSPSRYFTRRSARMLSIATDVGTITRTESYMVSVQPKDTRARLFEAKPTLIQERVAHDPWRLMVVVSLLNKTRASQAVPVFWRMMDTWPTASDLANASLPDLVAMLTPLGLQNGRAARLILFSTQYVALPPCTSRLYPLRSDKSYPLSEIAQYAGMGRYAVDSWRIYSPLLKGGGAPKGALEIMEARRASKEQPNDSDDEWRAVLPTDKELKCYLIWRWAIEGYKWSPERGRGAPVDDAYLEHILESEL